MKVIIRKAKIVDPRSSHHLKTRDILLDNGEIKAIASKIDDTAASEIKGKDLYVSIGFCDMRAFSKEPGHEAMETLESLSAAAAAGGFSNLGIMPNTEPIISSKESISYFKNFSKNSLTQLNAVAAITKNCKGEDFTEMWDLHANGAVAFSDGLYPLWNADIFLKTIQYLAPKKALIINKSEEPTLALFGQMHEGEASTRIGTKGIPSAAEEIMIQRDLKLLEYSGCKSETPLLHFTCISTAESVSLIRRAKAKGLPISCDVAAHHLTFTDNDLLSFDTNLKVSPPLRTRKDQKALLKGLEDGTIDAIVSDHNPLDEEHKKCEFDLADFGAIGLQTVLPSLLQVGLSPELIVEKLTKGYELLGLEQDTIQENTKANLTIFDQSVEWTFEEKDILSRSKNSPFIGRKLKGKVLAISNNGFTKIF
ncbi:dihydroorotase [Spirosomataceae bacterium TFI 002]|nr:dihydroorotase [Spirosomataceae bacterium TFI 002]